MAYEIGQKFTNTDSGVDVAISQIRDNGETIVLALVKANGETSTWYGDTETWATDQFAMYVRRGLYAAK